MTYDPGDDEHILWLDIVLAAGIVILIVIGFLYYSSHI